MCAIPDDYSVFVFLQFVGWFFSSVTRSRLKAAQRRIGAKDDKFYAFRNSSIPLRALTIIEDNRFLVVTQGYVGECNFALFTVTNRPTDQRWVGCYN